VPFWGCLWGTVATTLEYAFSDWAFARVSEYLGDETRGKELDKRGVGYRKLYDDEKRTLQPKDRNVAFIRPYDPDFLETVGALGFVEATGWQHALTFLLSWNCMAGHLSLSVVLRSFLLWIDLPFSNEPDIVCS